MLIKIVAYNVAVGDRFQTDTRFTYAVRKEYEYIRGNMERACKISFGLKQKTIEYSTEQGFLAALSYLRFEYDYEFFNLVTDWITLANTSGRQAG